VRLLQPRFDELQSKRSEQASLSIRPAEKTRVHFGSADKQVIPLPLQLLLKARRQSEEKELSFQVSVPRPVPQVGAPHEGYAGPVLCPRQAAPQPLGMKCPPEPFVFVDTKPRARLGILLVVVVHRHCPVVETLLQKRICQWDET